MYRATYERKRTGRSLTLAFALAAAIGAALPAAAKTVEPEATAEGMLADYTVYIGGLIVAEGSMKASLKGENYRLQNQLGSAGLPKKFWDAKWTMTSEGRVDGEKLHPSSFAFTSTENDETKKRLLTYNNGGMPALSFDPPLSPEERESTLPFERKGTLDPVSTFLVPVVNEGSPCNRKLPVFDGKRRYDLDLTFDRIDTITTRDNGYSGEAVRCKARNAARGHGEGETHQHPAAARRYLDMARAGRQRKVLLSGAGADENAHRRCRSGRGAASAAGCEHRGRRYP